MTKRIPIFLGLLFIVLAVWIQVTPLLGIQHWLTRLENIAYDFQLRAQRLIPTHTLDTAIAIVDIDDASIQKEGRWPWSRSKLAELLKKIKENGAVVIALDIFFSEKEDNMALVVLNEVIKKKMASTRTLLPLIQQIEPYFNHDAELASVLKTTDSVLATVFTPDNNTQGMIGPSVFNLSQQNEKKLAFITLNGYIGNISLLQQAAKSAGFINVFADHDGIVRQTPLLIEYQNRLYPSLALEAARLYLLTDLKLITASYGSNERLEGIQLGHHLIPTDAMSKVIIPFVGGSYTFPFFSASDVLQGNISPDAFAGKIIFVGSTASGLGDLKPTAIASIFPGVEIQATVAHSILKNNFFYKPDWALGAELCLTIVLGLLLTFLFPYLGPRLLALLAILLPLMLILANIALWQNVRLLFSIFIPIALILALALINLLHGYFFEARRRERLKEMFGQYVPEKHIDEMLQSKGNYGLLGETRDMTVLFADIRHFTTLSEKMSAHQLKNLLNDFFTPMTEIIFKHKGTIDKYVGDLIMAFWGAPLKDKRHARNAIAAALDMQKKLTDINPSLAAKGWPELHVGIGINSGDMNVGDMGSTFRRNYTVLGDAVNLASRIEGLTKYYGVKIIVTQDTQANQTRFVFRELDRVRVKGKKAGIAIYEVIDKESLVSTERKQEISLSESALHFYYQQNWADAKKIILDLKARHPEVILYSLYEERISEFEKNPPPVDWDGVYSHTAKTY